MSARRFPYLLFAVLLVFTGFAGCEEQLARTEQPLVLVSVAPQAWFVKRLAGDFVQVEVMIPPGASPHAYEPSIDQMRQVTSADLFIKIGHPHFTFEQAFLDRIQPDRPELRVVNSSAGIEQLPGDPHIWMSMSGARAMAANVAAALIELLPDRREEIEGNLRTLLAEVNDVDLKIREMLGPFEGRKFFVFHPAWGYFAREYGLEQVSIEHEGKEPNPQHLGHLMDDVRGSGARVIFIQPQFPKKSAIALARETGAAVVVLDPLSAEWLANMERTAVAMMEAFDEE